MIPLVVSGVLLLQSLRGILYVGGRSKDDLDILFHSLTPCIRLTCIQTITIVIVDLLVPLEVGETLTYPPMGLLRSDSA